MTSAFSCQNSISLFPTSSCTPTPNLPVTTGVSWLLIRGPKYWRFSFSISLSNEYSGLISFRMYWLDLLTLKSLLQHYKFKSINFWYSAFLIVQFSHPYMTTGETIALARHIFVSNVRSMIFNMLCRLVIAFLPRCKHLLISWLQSPSPVIFELHKIIDLARCGLLLQCNSITSWAPVGLWRYEQAHCTWPAPKLLQQSGKGASHHMLSLQGPGLSGTLDLSTSW